MRLLRSGDYVQTTKKVFRNHAGSFYPEGTRGVIVSTGSNQVMVKVTSEEKESFFPFLLDELTVLIKEKNG